MSDSRKRIEVAAALVFRNGLLLIAKRRAQDHLGGLWEFPGGKREASETFQECLKRELQEELGIEVRVENLFEKISHDYPDKSVDLKFFRCTLLCGEPKPIFCDEVAWVTAVQLCNYQFPAADACLLEKLKALPEFA